MNITIYRDLYDTHTLGELFINNKFHYYTMEDPYTGIIQSDPTTASLKIQDKSCIGVGKYQVIVSYSNRFKKLLPLVLNTLAFEGIRFHEGTKPEHSSGCILISRKKSKTQYLEYDKQATIDFTIKLLTAQKTNKITLEIITKNDYRHSRLRNT